MKLFFRLISVAALSLLALSAAISGIAASGLLYAFRFSGYDIKIEPVLAAIGIRTVAFVHFGGGQGDYSGPLPSDLSDS